MLWGTGAGESGGRRETLCLFPSLRALAVCSNLRESRDPEGNDPRAHVSCTPSPCMVEPTKALHLSCHPPLCPALGHAWHWEGSLLSTTGQHDLPKDFQSRWPRHSVPYL